MLLSQMLTALQPRPGAIYIDATFGAGGYATAILDAADCSVLALDRDSDAVRAAEAITARYPDRLTVVEAPFSRLEEVTRGHLSTGAGAGRPSVFTPPDGIVLDIGVSSMQLDEPERGFSFMADGPLDMRMGRIGATAADLVNSLDEQALADVLFRYGEERRSRRIARAIVGRRVEAPFARTRELAELVERSIGRRHDDPKHPATRTFQALRIAVNDELGELSQALVAAETLLAPGGRLVVVTFHSLEDRIVKTFLKVRSGKQGSASRHLPSREPERRPSFEIVNQRGLSPSAEECAANPRARSARLRWGIRTDAPAWGATGAT